MRPFTIALLQMAGHQHDVEANLKQGIEFCKQAQSMGADFALFPEMWNIGYHSYDPNDPDGLNEFKKLAITQDSEFFQSFVNCAKELEIGIGITYLEKYGDEMRNAISIIDKHGDILLTYTKVHTCVFFPMEGSCVAGDHWPVCDFPHDDGHIKIGSMICYDREFPESARSLMLNGAEIIVTPNCCGLDHRRLDQFKTRAFENAVATAMTNYAAPTCNGHSIAFDAEGELIVDSGKQEQITLAQFDVEALRTYRKTTVWGNAFRRPEHYQQLCSNDRDEVFTRTDAFNRPFVATLNSHN